MGDGKTKTTEDTEDNSETTEEENTSEKHDTTNEVSVSLIGSPQCDENHDEGNQEETGTETIGSREDPVQVQVDDHVTQEEQEIEKESLSAASTEHEVPNEVEEMQSVIVPEEGKSDEILTKDDILHEHKNEEKETEQNSDLSEDVMCESGSESLESKSDDAGSE